MLNLQTCINVPVRLLQYLKSFQLSSILLSFGLLALSVFSSSALAASELQKRAEQVRSAVQLNIDTVLEVYEREKIYANSDPDRFLSTMEQELARIVDFKRIAARVMGKYARRATKEQRGQFTQVFKESLFDTYTKTIVNQGSFKIEVVKAEINPRSDERATVDMDVTADSGRVYPMTYSMYYTKEGEWLMENVIVFGINVGLAFRDKFESEYRKHKGNIADVLDNWSVVEDVQETVNVELSKEASR